MKIHYLTGCCLALCLGALSAPGQELSETEKLRIQLKEVQEKFEKQQQEMREMFERMSREQQAQIDLLKKQIEQSQKTGAVAVSTNPPLVTGASTNVAAANPTTNAPASAQEVGELKQKVDELMAAAKRSPINQFNPGIGFAVDSIFSYTGSGSDATGSERAGGYDAFLRTAELNLEATVDPFARAYGVIAASADAQTGEADLGVEEAAIVTTSLLCNLTVQGGRFFADFGRFSYVHDHDLPFVYRPLVLDRYIGGESRTDGAQVNYLFPTEHFISLTLGVGDSFGGDLAPSGVNGYRSVGELNTWAHLSTYFDMTPNLSLETGVSGMEAAKATGVGDDPTQRDRYIGGADITLRYQPLDSAIRRGFTWGTEVLFNSARFEDDSGVETRRNAAGLYSYLETKITRQWKTGFLFDWMEDPATHNAQTFRYSPYVTWNPSEFQTLRLQYSHTEPNSATGCQSSDAIYLQWTAILGRHVHGFKQR